MDETIQPQEGTNPEPEVEVEVTTPEGDGTAPEVPEEKTYTQAEWDELHGRARKAEAELKALRPTKSAKPVAVSSQNNTVEETVLLANGMSEELLGELKAVAQARRIPSLIKAQNDPIFIAVKDKFERDQRQKDASLPAPRNSGGIKPKKSIDSPGLSRDEHRRLAMEANP